MCEIRRFRFRGRPHGLSDVLDLGAFARPCAPEDFTPADLAGATQARRPTARWTAVAYGGPSAAAARWEFVAEVMPA